jgi:Tfp pilus assembly protein PilE
MRQIILKKIQRGLTLLQKMVIIAIIGILAQVALSTYQEYVAQEQTTKQ